MGFRILNPLRRQFIFLPSTTTVAAAATPLFPADNAFHSAAPPSSHANNYQAEQLQQQLPK